MIQQFVTLNVYYPKSEWSLLAFFFSLVFLQISFPFFICGGDAEDETKSKNDKGIDDLVVVLSYIYIDKT